MIRNLYTCKDGIWLLENGSKFSAWDLEDDDERDIEIEVPDEACVEAGEEFGITEFHIIKPKLVKIIGRK